MKTVLLYSLLLPFALVAKGESEAKSQMDPMAAPRSMPSFGGSSTMQGKQVMLEGKLPSVGTSAPDFQLTDGQLNPATLADLGPGKKILNIVTSLDTSVCQQQTQRFAQEVEQLPGYTLYTISTDLPFAQQRWAKEAGLEGLTFLSDYRDSSFGRTYGLQVHELQLLNRALIILDEDNTVRYVQKVDEMTDHPDYQAAAEAAKNI